MEGLRLGGGRVHKISPIIKEPGASGEGVQGDLSAYPNFTDLRMFLSRMGWFLCRQHRMHHMGHDLPSHPTEGAFALSLALKKSPISFKIEPADAKARTLSIEWLWPATSNSWISGSICSFGDFVIILCGSVPDA